MDDATKEYCLTVARIIREHHSVLGRSKGFYVPKKKMKNSAKNTTDDGHMSPKMEHNMLQRRLSMPGNLISMNHLIGGKDCNRSMSLGDRHPSSIVGSCLPYMDIGLTIPVPAFCPVTPDFAISSYHDFASRILQLNSNSINAMLQAEQRRSSLPNISSRPPPSSISVGSSIQEPTKVNQDIRSIIDAPPSSENKILQEKNRRSSLPNSNVQTTTSFIHYPNSAGEFHFPNVCPAIPDCSKGARGNDIVVHEVDISDSAIHEMWSSDDS